MPTEFEPSATMFLQVLLGRLHVSVKAMADATDSCIRALLNHLSIKVMLPQIAQGSKDLKNTTLRRRCLEYTLLMLQLHGAEAVQPYCEVFEEVLSRALGDASLECRSTARDILHLYHEYFPDRAVRVVQSIDRTVRKTLELSFGVNALLLSDSDLITNTTPALSSSAGTLNTATITPDTPLSSSTPTSAISPEPLSPASSPPSSPRSVRSVRSIQSAAPTTKPRDTKPVTTTPSRAPSVSGLKKPSTSVASSAKTSAVKTRPASVNLSSPKSSAPVTPVAAVTRSNSVSKPKDTPSKSTAPAPASKAKLSLAQVAKSTVTAKRAVTALTANKPPAKRLELPSLKAAKSASTLPKSGQSSTPSTAPSSPIAPSAPVRAEDSSEVLALKLHRLMERTRRSIVRDQLIVPHV